MDLLARMFFIRKWPDLRRFACTLVVMLVLAAQAAATLHLTQHSIHGENDNCQICVTAQHFGNAPLPEAPVHVVAIQPFIYSAEECAEVIISRSVSPYASRAPPSFS